MVQLFQLARAVQVALLLASGAAALRLRVAEDEVDARSQSVHPARARSVPAARRPSEEAASPKDSDLHADGLTAAPEDFLSKLQRAENGEKV